MPRSGTRGLREPLIVVMLKTEHSFRFDRSGLPMSTPSQRSPLSSRPRRSAGRRRSARPGPLAGPLRAGNAEAASDLERIADLLEARGEADHRVQAYRRAAESLRELRRDLRDVARRGERALRALPNVGPRLAPLLYEHVRTGTIRLLERLLAERDAHAALDRAVVEEGAPARLVHEQVDSLEALELAHEGQLEGVAGFGDRRVASLRTKVHRMLVRRARGRSTGPLGRRRAPQEADPSVRRADVDTPEALQVPVALLLELDARYRMLAAEGKLRRIAPHRFNPDQLAWLPVMVDHRQGWRFDVMYSNSARAHRLAKTQDWVIIRHRPATDEVGNADYGDDDGDEDVESGDTVVRGEGHHTIVTESRGPDAGLRVVRGRERACHEHHVEHPPARPKLELPEFLKPSS